MFDVDPCIHPTVGIVTMISVERSLHWKRFRHDDGSLTATHDPEKSP